MTRDFIGRAMEVHSAVGPGLDEEIYHQELAVSLTSAEIQHLSKPKRDLVYRGIVADTFVPDFVIGDHFIPELKCLRGTFAAEHLLQAFCYCKFWRLRTSLLVNFGKQSLIWKRLLYRSHTSDFSLTRTPDVASQQSLASDIVGAIRECLNEVGLGYRQTTWMGLAKAAIQSTGLNVESNPSVTVLNRHGVALDSLVVEGSCAIVVSALTDGISPTDRAILQTHLRWLNLPWGMIFHFGKTKTDLAFVQYLKKKSAGLPESAGIPKLNSYSPKP